MKDLIAKLQMDAADQILATFTTLEMQLQGFAKSSYEKDLRIAELEAQIAAASAPAVDSDKVICANLGELLLTQAERKAADTDKLREAILALPLPVPTHLPYGLHYSGGDMQQLLELAADTAASTALQAPVREVPERNAVIVVKPWQERCSGFAKRYMTELAQKAIEDEITELRAALAATAAPVLSNISAGLSIPDAKDFDPVGLNPYVVQEADAIPKISLSDDQLDKIARSYFAEEWAQNHLKNAIHDAFITARSQP